MRNKNKLITIPNSIVALPGGCPSRNGLHLGNCLSSWQAFLSASKIRMRTRLMRILGKCFWFIFVKTTISRFSSFRSIRFQWNSATDIFFQCLGDENHIWKKDNWKNFEKKIYTFSFLMRVFFNNVHKTQTWNRKWYACKQRIFLILAWLVALMSLQLLSLLLYIDSSSRWRP